VIETYKILTGKYQPCVAPILRKGSVYVYIHLMMTQSLVEYC